MKRANKIAIFIGAVLVENNTVLLFQRKEFGDWTIPCTLFPTLNKFKDIPIRICLCGMQIELTDVLGVHQIGERQYLVTITGKTMDSSFTLTEHYSKAEWANISELIKYPIKPGQRFCIENALSNLLERRYKYE